MDLPTMLLERFGERTLIIAIIAVILTSLIKPLYKKKLSDITDQKIYADKLKDFIFFTLFTVSLISTAIYVYLIQGMEFDLNYFFGQAFSGVTAAELIYLLYEKTGLRGIIKVFMKKNKSDENITDIYDAIQEAGTEGVKEDKTEAQNLIIPDDNNSNNTINIKVENSVEANIERPTISQENDKTDSEIETNK